MKHILHVTDYNQHCTDNANKALLDNGECRQTGYVLVDHEKGLAEWFPNYAQANIERCHPGKYPGTGTVLYSREDKKDVI